MENLNGKDFNEFRFAHSTLTQVIIQCVLLI